MRKNLPQRIILGFSLVGMILGSGLERARADHAPVVSNPSEWTWEEVFPVEEVTALNQLKAQCFPAWNWNPLDSYLVGTPPTGLFYQPPEWTSNEEETEYTLTRHGHVTGLDLAGKGLRGTLPTELNNLPELTFLNFNKTDFDFGPLQNDLSGPIPPIERLTKLEHLSILENRVTGPIPPLATLTNLRYLDLADNSLNGSIPPLGNLKELNVLNLRNNELDGSIPSLSGLSKLQYLQLSDNQLNGDIPDLDDLVDLLHIELERNNLTGEIPSLSALSNLTYLNLQENELSGGIPPSLSALSQLQILSLWGNNLDGELPPLSGLSNLEFLFLSQNNLSGEIPSFRNLTNLKRIYLDTNAFSGEIPAFDGLSNLEDIVLGFNQLDGPIPPLNGLTGLFRIDFAGNRLEGPIPSLDDLRSLIELSLEENFISGPIPDLGSLTNLQYLFLEDNRLTGQIPPSIGNLSFLKEVYLGRNFLDGPLPATVAGMDSLEEVDLSDNVGLAQDPVSAAQLDAFEGTGGAVWRDTFQWNFEMKRMRDRDAVTNGSNPSADIDASLEPAPNPGIIDRQPSVTKGFVADGVTPLVFKFAAPYVRENLILRTEIVAGDNPIENLTSNTRSLGEAGDSWTSDLNGDQRIWVYPDWESDPGTVYAFHPAFSSTDVVDPTTKELHVRVQVIEPDADVPIFSQLIPVRKPPILLIHGYNSDGNEWSEQFRDVLAADRHRSDDPGDNFVRKVKYGVGRDRQGKWANTHWPLWKLDLLLSREIDDDLSMLRGNWAFTRPDLVCHSQGGVLARMLCSKKPYSWRPPFRNSANYYRGRFHRVVTIGSPHNGSRLLRYLKTLLHGPAPENSRPRFVAEKLSDIGLVQLKFDPFGQQIKNLNTPNGRWEPDSSARFHYVRTRINGGVSPSETSSTLAEWAIGLGNDYGPVVLNSGSDGVVDYDSMSPVSSSGQHTVTGNIAHAAVSQYGFDFFGTSISQFDSTAVAQHVSDTFKNDSDFVSLSRPTLLDTSISTAIDNAASRVKVLEVNFIISILRDDPTKSAGVSTFDLVLEEVEGETISGDVRWFAEIHGPEGITTDQVTVSVDPSDSRLVSVKAPDDFIGDLVVFAMYQSESGTMVFSTPVVVQTQLPPDVTLTGIEVSPTSTQIPVGSRISPEIWEIYSDGSRLKRFLDSALLTVASKDSNLIDLSDPLSWEATHSGTATVEVQWKGKSAESRIDIFPAENPAIDRDLVLPSDLPIAPGRTPAAYHEDQQGAYWGLLRSDEETDDAVTLAGYCSGKISHSAKRDTGSFSLSIIYDKVKYAVRGSVDEFGGIVAQFSKKDSDRTTMTFSAQLVDTLSGRKLTGALTGDGKTTRIDLFQRVFHAKRYPAPFAGRKTIALPADLDADSSIQPGGDGIGHGLMSTSGVMRTVMVVGDGTKATSVLYLSSDGEIMFYRTLYRKPAAGWIGGVIATRDLGNTSDADGTLHWKKGSNPKERLYPGGFDLQQRAILANFRIPDLKSGERVISELPDRESNAVFNIRGGNTPPIEGKFLTWSSNNRISHANPTRQESLSIKVSAASGFVSGRYRNKSARQDLRFQGVVVQEQGLVVGNFVGNGETGRILIDSTGFPSLLVERASDGSELGNDATLDFGSVGIQGGISEIGIRIRNTGDGALRVRDGSQLTSAQGGFFLSSYRFGHIPAGGESIVRFQFNPEAEGTETGSFSLISNDENASPFTLNLTGSGVPGNQSEGREFNGSPHTLFPGDRVSTPSSDPSGYDQESFPGNYFGMVRKSGPKNEPAGTISLKISPTGDSSSGSVSGRIAADGRVFGIRGSLDSDGAFDGLIKGKNSENHRLSMQLHRAVSEGTPQIVGFLIDDAASLRFDFVALNIPWHSRNLPFDKSNSYTLLMPHNDDLGTGYPGGAGAGIMTVNSAGSARLLKYLADGTKLSWSGKVSGSGQLGVYRELDRLRPVRSMISGLLSFRGVAGTSDLDGEFYWRRVSNGRSALYPDGFETTRTVIGCSYSKPDKQEFALETLPEGESNASLQLSGFGLDESFQVTWNETNKVVYTPDSTERLTAKISTRNGFVTGYWWDKGNSGQRYQFRGVIFQKQQLTGGYWYFKKGQTGLFQMIPNP